MFARHDLVWLSAHGWLAARAAAAPEHVGVIESWQREDWPAIVRRSDADAGPGQVCLGIALPPHPVTGNKVRIALRALVSDVAKTTPALALMAAPVALPEKWQPSLRALIAEAGGLTLRIYGSLALQALTGQPYVSPSSDIDLLFYPETEPQLRAGLALLAQHAGQLPLDGEIVFPSGQAVAWKEWPVAQTGNARVLVKEAHMVRLVPASALLATLRPA
jgi:phosphoribosyl-dephospho-CoA transferase